MYQQLRKSVATVASLTERELRLFEQQCVYREVTGFIFVENLFATALDSFL